MANTNSPQGFQCVTPNARQNAYTIATGYATTINLGDPVAGTGTGTGSLPGIQIATINSPVVGVFVGCQYVDSNGQPQYSKSWPASTTATSIEAYVIDDPFAVFEIQYSGTLSVNDYYNKGTWVAGAGTQGISGYQFDTTTLGTGADLQVRRNYPAPDNAVGANSKVLVGFMQHTFNYPYTAI